MQKFHIGSLSALLITATFLTGAGCTAETSVGTVVELTPTTEFSSTGNTEEGVPYSFQGTVPQDWTEHEDKDPRVLGQIYSPTTDRCLQRGDEIRRHGISVYLLSGSGPQLYQSRCR